MSKEEMLAIIAKAEAEKRSLTDDEKLLLDNALAERNIITVTQEENGEFRTDKVVTPDGVKPVEEEPAKEDETREDPNEEEPEKEEEPKEEEPEKEEEPKEEEPKEETTKEEVRNNNNNQVNINKKMEKRFSLVRAIRSVVNGQGFDQVDEAVINAGKAENRSFEANGQIQLPTNLEERAAITVSAEGEDVVPTDLFDIWGPLRAKNVLVNAGARVYDNLVGDVQIPLMGKGSVTWEGETDAAKDGAPTFTHVNLSPKRLTAYVEISKKLIAQDSIGVENAVRQELINAINAKLEETLLGTASGSTTMPEGIFYTKEATSATAGNTINSFSGVCAAEAAIEDENVTGECVYVMSNKAKAAFRGMIKGTNATGMVFENGEMDGTKAFNTSNIAGKGFLYGDFSNLVIGNWSGLDLTVDPYTLAGNGKIKLVVNMFVDAKLVRPNAIKAGYVA